MSEHELRRKYPYMFAHPNCLDIEVAIGWLPIFSKLCEEIDANGGGAIGFYWRQVKEKMGTPRLRWSAGKVRSRTYAHFIPRPRPIGSNSEIIQRITDLIQVAQDQLDDVCIACGATPANLDFSGGYCLNLCTIHAAARQGHSEKSTSFVKLYEDPLVIAPSVS